MSWATTLPRMMEASSACSPSAGLRGWRWVKAPSTCLSQRLALGSFRGPLAVEGGFEGAAVGVAADDGVFYVQDFDGVLDGGGARRRRRLPAGDGDDVAGVAGDEEVAGAGLEDEVGDDAGVRAGDEEPLGGLHLGEQVELRLLLGKTSR
jgi:hypothetical protein